MPRALFMRIVKGAANPGDADLFRGQMLTEMARMSLDDKLVLQIHPGAWRNHNAPLFDRFGAERRRGYSDAPPTTSARCVRCSIASATIPRLSIIVFTLDESSYARELAPLAGHYPALKLGPRLVVPRQSRRHDAFPRADHRDRRVSTTPSVSTTTRAPSCPFRRATTWRAASTAHSSRAWWPNIACREDEAATLAPQLAYEFPKKAYKL